MKELRVMLVSQPGAWQLILQKQLETYPYVELVGISNGCLTATQLVKQVTPDLLLIDFSIAYDDILALVEYLKKENPDTRLLVITDTSQQQRRLIKAGADYALSTFNYEMHIGAVLDQLQGAIESRYR